jgi:predicted nucleotidyltransferase
MSEKDPHVISYRPSVWYFRQALRKSKDMDEVRDIGFLLCTAYEREREWIRNLGLIPPKQVMLEEEVRAKGWDVDPIAGTDPKQIQFPFFQ